MLVLVTPRFYLRDFESGDFWPLYAEESDERVATSLGRPPLDHDQVRERLERWIEASFHQPRNEYRLAVIARDDHTFVGDVKLELNVSDWRNEAELGYALLPQFWGRGYATEMAHAMMRFGFEELDLHRVFAYVRAANAGSWRVLEKLGMRHEAAFVDCEHHMDGWQTIYVYAMLRREWRG